MESPDLPRHLTLGRSGTVQAGGGNLISVSRNRCGGVRIVMVIGKMTVIFDWH
jgi:hypothetical protein